LEGIQAGLTVAGFVPVVGEAANAASAIISLVQGDYAGAGMSIFAMIPFVGGIGDAAKLARLGEEAAKAAKGAEDLIKAGEAAEGLTGAEREAIQAISNKYGTTIDVVGSRAAGTGRNIESSLPVGKGANFRSDIDFRIDASHPQVDDLISELKGVGNGAGSASTRYSTTTRATTAPFIRFTPNQ
jgi:hypothetical protein